jgi:hypothetical protein
MQQARPARAIVAVFPDPCQITGDPKSVSTAAARSHPAVDDRAPGVHRRHVNPLNYDLISAMGILLGSADPEVAEASARAELRR